MSPEMFKQILEDFRSGKVTLAASQALYNESVKELGEAYKALQGDEPMSCPLVGESVVDKMEAYTALTADAAEAAEVFEKALAMPAPPTQSVPARPRVLKEVPAEVPVIREDTRQAGSPTDSLTTPLDQMTLHKALRDAGFIPRRVMPGQEKYDPAAADLTECKIRIGGQEKSLYQHIVYDRQPISFELPWEAFAFNVKDENSDMHKSLTTIAGSASTSIMPIDAWGRPTNRLVRRVDMITKKVEVGMDTFVDQPPAPTGTLPGSEGDFGKALGADATELNYVIRNRRDAKVRRAAYMRIENARMNAHPDVMYSVTDWLSGRIYDDMENQILNGSGTGNEMLGIFTQLAETAAAAQGIANNLTALTGTDSTFAGGTARTDIGFRDPLLVLSEAAVRLWGHTSERPDMIVVGETDYQTIAAAMRLQRQLIDISASQIADIPIVVCFRLPADTILLMNSSERNVYVSVASNPRVMTLDQVYLVAGQTGFVSEYYAQMALKRPFTMWRVTGTNNFAIRSS